MIGNGLRQGGVAMIIGDDDLGLVVDAHRLEQGHGQGNLAILKLNSRGHLRRVNAVALHGVIGRERIEPKEIGTRGTGNLCPHAVKVRQIIILRSARESRKVGRLQVIKARVPVNWTGVGTIEDRISRILRDKGGGQALLFSRLEQRTSPPDVASFLNLRREHSLLIQFNQVIVLAIPEDLIGEAMMGSVRSGKRSHDAGDRVSGGLRLRIGIAGPTGLQARQERGIGGIVQFGVASIQNDHEGILGWVGLRMS